MNGVEWKLVDMIKKGVITFQKGDVVKVFRRKVNGYPRGLKDDEEYFVRNIDSDSLFVAQHSSDGIGPRQASYLSGNVTSGSRVTLTPPKIGPLAQLVSSN